MINKLSSITFKTSSLSIFFVELQTPKLLIRERTPDQLFMFTKHTMYNLCISVTGMSNIYVYVVVNDDNVDENRSRIVHQ